MKIYYHGKCVKMKTQPNHKRHPVEQKEQRSYSWTNETRNKFKSRVSQMFWESLKTGKSMYFFTLTQKDSIESNQPITKFINNLRKRNVIDRFGWVRERQARGANHYHLVLESESDYICYKMMQKAWNSAQESSGGTPSPNSFRSGKEPRIRHYGGVIHYLTKYATKDVNNESYPIYRTSKGLKGFATVADHDVALSALHTTQSEHRNDYFELSYLKMTEKAFEEIQALEELNQLLINQYLQNESNFDSSCFIERK